MSTQPDNTNQNPKPTTSHDTATGPSSSLPQPLPSFFPPPVTRQSWPYFLATTIRHCHRSTSQPLLAHHRAQCQHASKHPHQSIFPNAYTFDLPPWTAHQNHHNKNNEYTTTLDGFCVRHRAGDAPCHR
ncbi:proline-rich receptor-like protein kinase PERK8 [Iris pallida]|uniref:Proline-rich receptor-like protein kinase PERK8 n=1 Tax=Iris pallida TaxID=29817 RepID=A0AAX6HVJ4_IRIPA|nr:proline-rich receptor-like protein kinase PERK8 [Iris pallida]